jgi:hypothetical protein
MGGLDAIVFDTKNLTLQSDDGGERVWVSGAGDVVTLYYLTKRQSLRAVPEELDSIRAASRQQAARYGGAIVEVDLCVLNGAAAVREILKMPQNPTGMGYFGSFSIPLADCGYLLSVAGREKGVTGMRDTAIFAKLMQSGEIAFGEEGDSPKNWMGDPYDASIVGVPARNRADDEAYDSQFPDHPLSRVRALLRQIESSLRISDLASPG